MLNFLDAPLIHRYKTVEMQKAFIKYYATRITPDRLVVVEPGIALLCIDGRDIPESVMIELKASLCIKMSMIVWLRLHFMTLRPRQRRRGYSLSKTIVLKTGMALNYEYT